MRFLHTADWHLGRILHGIHLTQDQRVLLDELVALVEDRRPDAVLVAGDVYDRAVPPPEAVELLDATLSRIVLDLGVPVVLIAGNHDSPDRLGFGSRMLARQGLLVAGRLSREPARLRLEDDHGPVDVFALPYVDPPFARDLFPDRSVGSHDDAIRTMTDHVRAGSPDGVRRVLVAHAFVAGGTVSDSERPLSVGGAGTVDADAFGGFDYVALGHLHRRQSVGSDRIRYAGSLFKYSFSEATHQKSVDLITLGPPGHEPEVETVALHPRVDLRRLDGTMDELLAMPASEDYLTVMLRDRRMVYDAVGKLRERFPNVLHVERPVAACSDDSKRVFVDRRKTSDRDLFAQFFAEMEGRDLEDEEMVALTAVLEELERGSREVSA